MRVREPFPRAGAWATIGAVAVGAYGSRYMATRRSTEGMKGLVLLALDIPGAVPITTLCSVSL